MTPTNFFGVCAEMRMFPRLVFNVCSFLLLSFSSNDFIFIQIFKQKQFFESKKICVNGYNISTFWMDISTLGDQANQSKPISSDLKHLYKKGEPNLHKHCRQILT
jgi:hypothetical protein